MEITPKRGPWTISVMNDLIKCMNDHLFISCTPKKRLTIICRLEVTRPSTGPRFPLSGPQPRSNPSMILTRYAWRTTYSDYSTPGAPCQVWVMSYPPGPRRTGYAMLLVLTFSATQPSVLLRGCGQGVSSASMDAPCCSWFHRFYPELPL